MYVNQNEPWIYFGCVNVEMLNLSSHGLTDEISIWGSTRSFGLAAHNRLTADGTFVTRREVRFQEKKA